MSHPQLDGMPSKEFLAAARDKWGLSNEEDLKRANITACILEMQAKHFQRLVEETRALGAGVFSKELFPALKESFKTHVLPDICAIQPMTGPIGIIYWYQPREGEMEEAISVNVDGEEKKVKIPSVVLDIAEKEICAESRRLKALTAETGMGDIVNGVLTEITREILSTMLNCAETDEFVGGSYDDYITAISQTSHIIHRETQRGPANNILGSKKALERLGLTLPKPNGHVQKITTMLGRWNVYYDDLFPENKLLEWNSGVSALDTGIVYSPYTLVEITPTFVDPGDMSLRRAVRTRHKITVVRPEFFRVLNLPE